MIVRGPFELKWGDNVITDVEEIDVEHTVDSEDYSTIQGRTIEIDGAYKSVVTLTLLASDIPTLSALFPQYFVANGQELSTGETVNHADGAIDVRAASCGDDIVYNNLDIISCGSPSNVLRLVNARTRMDGIELDDKVQKVMVKFIGESTRDEATMQFFREGTIAVVS